MKIHEINLQNNYKKWSSLLKGKRGHLTLHTFKGFLNMKWDSIITC